MIEKIRLDLLLVNRGLIDSREKAKAVVMAGHVMVNGERETTPGKMLPDSALIEVRNYEKKYVSRGGFKLEKALSVFPLTLENSICIDGGASTGGFTDCMLKNGAKKVYAIDVGYGQLAWSLRTDERVVNLERTNIRHVTSTQVPELVDFISIDVSFISLSLVIPPLAKLLREEGEIVALIKPQFEAGRENVGKKGVVRDPLVHQEVIEKVMKIAIFNGLAVKGIDFSPIKGPEGNIEFLIYLKKCESDGELPSAEDVVEAARNSLSTPIKEDI